MVATIHSSTDASPVPAGFIEPGADLDRLRQDVWRWSRWLRGGLCGRVGTKGRFIGIWVAVLKRLHLTGDGIHPR
ncbi:hypothetical protein CCR95_22740 [Thiocystis minor]|uniref:hypothetical protein n=1 Tax=Thiocystis minor TaxID=61597 RepID=UPI001912EC09|nr:hypothetical protein [Thiocystis minor]MBK5966812.1 hypothetical protein [Thiocystis minor]